MSTQFATQPALLCKSLYKLQVGTYKSHTFNFVSESRPAIIYPALLFSNLENRKYRSYTLCENEYVLGMLYFSAHHSVPTFGMNIFALFFYVCASS